MHHLEGASFDFIGLACEVAVDVGSEGDFEGGGFDDGFAAVEGFKVGKEIEVDHNELADLV